MNTFKTASLCSLFVSMSYANPAGDAINKWQADQFRQNLNSMVQSIQWNQASASEPVGDATGYLIVYAQSGKEEGYGTLKKIEGGFFRGAKEHYYIVLNTRHYLPALTDSVFLFGRKGIPEADGKSWLFIGESGSISTYSRIPDTYPVKVSVNGGEKVPFDKEEVSTVIRKIKLAGYFIDRDFGYSLRLYNSLSDKSFANPAKEGYSTNSASSLFFSESISNFDMDNLKNKTPDNFIEMSIVAKYLCGKKQFEEAKSYLNKLNTLLPNMYSTYKIQGSCYEGEQKYAEAAKSYALAFQYAPENDDILNFLDNKYAKMSEMKK